MTLTCVFIIVALFLKAADAVLSKSIVNVALDLNVTLVAVGATVVAAVVVVTLFEPTVVFAAVVAV